MDVSELINVLSKCDPNADLKFYMVDKSEELDLREIEVSLYMENEVTFILDYD